MHQFFWVAFVNFNIEDVDAGEFFEQYRLAFHDRLRGKWPDRTKSKHRSTVGNDSHEIAARRQVARFIRVLCDFFAYRGDTGCVGEGQIALRGEWLGGGNLDLSRHRIAVVVERSVLQIVRHFHVISPMTSLSCRLQQNGSNG